MIKGQTDLFADQEKLQAQRFREQHAPLAARMRPKVFADYIGQEHILGADKPLRKALDHGYCSSMILWGPPGTGKTTLAEIFASAVHAQVERLSAVTAGIKDIRDAIDVAKDNLLRGTKTVVFVDEVHRFNKVQQDAFLPYIENGTIIFIGATTENPSFEVNNALLSRVRIYILKSLTDSDISKILLRALLSPAGLADRKLILEEGVLSALVQLAGGDARRALNLLEIVSDLAEKHDDGQNHVTLEHVASIGSERVARYDKNGDRFYDLISAFHKSVRGSSPQAALYWYARIVSAGGDPLYVARRLLAIASEDIGNADPYAMQVCIAAWDCYERVGAAEGERAIAQAAVYCAVAPKSNALYQAWNAVLAEVQTLPDYDVPMHLRNAPTKLMEQMGCHQGYRYAHDEAGAYAAGECYLPEELRHRHWYQPNDRGYEQQIQRKMAYLQQRDLQSTNRRFADTPEDNEKS